MSVLGSISHSMCFCHLPIKFYCTVLKSVKYCPPPKKKKKKSYILLLLVIVLHLYLKHLTFSSNELSVIKAKAVQKNVGVVILVDTYSDFVAFPPITRGKYSDEGSFMLACCIGDH